MAKRDAGRRSVPAPPSGKSAEFEEGWADWFGSTDFSEEKAADVQARVEADGGSDYKLGWFGARAFHEGPDDQPE